MITHNTFKYLMEKKEQELEDMKTANLQLAERLRNEERSTKDFFTKLLGIDCYESRNIMGVFTDKFKITLILRSGKEVVFKVVRNEEN